MVCLLFVILLEETADVKILLHYSGLKSAFKNLKIKNNVILWAKYFFKVMFLTILFLFY